jgi:hypothetical protein
MPWHVLVRLIPRELDFEDARLKVNRQRLLVKPCPARHRPSVVARSAALLPLASSKTARMELKIVEFGRLDFKGLDEATDFSRLL